MKILLVDDVDFFLEVEKNILQLSPATLLTAHNGHEALEAAARHLPELIFMDVNMPVMDGLTCCRLLKGNPELRSIPVIMVFAPSRNVDEASCLEAGCDGVVTKPIDSRAFLEMGRRFHPAIERRAERLPLNVPLKFRFDGREFRGLGLDLGQGGVYVASAERVKKNERLRLTLQLPAAGPKGVEVRGKVAWVNQGLVRAKKSLPEGFGVEFRALSPEAVAALADCLAAHKSSDEAPPRPAEAAAFSHKS